jgi:hypothetical protein
LILSALRRGGLTRWLGVWTLSVLGVFTFYPYFAVLVSQNMGLTLIWLRGRRPWNLAAWLGGQLVLLLLFAPWLLAHWDKLRINLTQAQQMGMVMPHSPIWPTIWA